MLVITTYLNDNAQTPLNRFVAGILYNQVCNKYSDKSKRWSLGLSLSVASIAVGAISSSPLSTTLLISINGMRGEFFLSKSSYAYKLGHVSKTTLLLGVICHPFGKT